MSSDLSRFSLKNKNIVVTGASGLLGRQHSEVIAEAGGVPVLLDVAMPPLEALAAQLVQKYNIEPLVFVTDITQKQQLEQCLKEIESRLGAVHGLVNNAANNPKVESQDSNTGWMRFENLDLSIWEKDLAVGLTGAFLCSQVFGSAMARSGGGVIVNISSDLSLIAPDQRLYRVPGLPDSEQPVKSVTYSVVKTGLIGLTRYLAGYWSRQGVRVNAISPGGVENGQPEDFQERLSQLIPLGRMARVDEYRASLLFLLSDASSYMTGTNLVVDGGRTVL
jgi:NAD(P)-dependent dehydrogenase (short-subunit alcohol dehydrogenase family)